VSPWWRPVRPLLPFRPTTVAGRTKKAGVLEYPEGIRPRRLPRQRAPPALPGCPSPGCEPTAHPIVRRVILPAQDRFVEGQRQPPLVDDERWVRAGFSHLSPFPGVDLSGRPPVAQRAGRLRKSQPFRGSGCSSLADLGLPKGHVPSRSQAMHCRLETKKRSDGLSVQHERCAVGSHLAFRPLVCPIHSTYSAYSAKPPLYISAEHMSSVLFPLSQPEARNSFVRQRAVQDNGRRKAYPFPPHARTRQDKSCRIASFPPRPPGNPYLRCPVGQNHRRPRLRRRRAGHRCRFPGHGGRRPRRRRHRRRHSPSCSDSKPTPWDRSNRAPNGLVHVHLFPFPNWSRQ
jgi:hypothetical protein